MSKRKILIVRWGQIRIHDYYLATLLTSLNYEVEFAFYIPSYAYKEKHINDLFFKVKAEYLCYDFKETFIKKQLIRLNTLIERLFNRSLPCLSTGFLLSGELRQKVNIESYDYIVPIEQTSLYWVATAYKYNLNKIIYYSLEIQKKDDLDIPLNFKVLLEKEKQWLHSGILGLIIQDKFRAETLLESTTDGVQLNIAYLPVFVPGNPIFSKSNFLSERLCISGNKKIVLYFGEVYEERKLPELTNEFNKIKSKDYVLVFHGSKHYKAAISDVPDNIIISEEFVPFEDINQVIASAYIGLAFYDNTKLNSRYTAFSSEKITRYLQCGVPFLAFKNETYIALNEIAECAFLIDDFSQLEEAINTINNQYNLYSNNALEAFRHFSNDNNQASLKRFFDLLNRP